jgi:uncharacterized protein YlzI (FlbEa/FlbD family)
MFIQLTHTYSGEKIFVRADQIHTIRQKEGKTLVITHNKGMYVDESVELVKDTVESILGVMKTC